VVGLIVKSATVVLNGLQSHCWTLASKTRKHFFGDVIIGISPLHRRIYITSCARILGRETCHTLSTTVNNTTQGTQFPKSGFVNTSLSVDRIYVKSVGD